MEFNYSEALTHLLSHVYRLYRHNVDLLIQEYGVYPGQPPLLMRLTEQDGQIQKELASKVHVQPATLNVMIGRMEKAGLVERRPDADNYRVSRVYLTEKGRLATSAVKSVLKEIEERCFARFSAEDKAVFRQLLQRMHDDLRQLKHENETLTMKGQGGEQTYDAKR
ncbi:MarR family winged helix-turn-helix transcriptional regulator [Gordoniibacillus kamchatkensis]|uniref:MarR family winged helix-turn-helix transcriptional regulator n=1 Tax=Gordoniibacillus kamchatkensis TaxID=1590651 RepID=UPI000698D092|nr:MarR family transcriptional regulator [Paenibacillus sp. VKM B-2647]